MLSCTRVHVENVVVMLTKLGLVGRSSYVTLSHCMWFACVLPCVCTLQGVQGTGAGGRIVSRDVAAAQVTAPSTAGPYQTIELSNMRKVNTLIELVVGVGCTYHITGYISQN